MEDKFNVLKREDVENPEQLKPRKGPGFTVDDLAEMFTYHPPDSQETIERYAAIRSAGFHLASTILRECPPCATTTAAIRTVWEATMKANGAIATGGKV